MSYKPIMEVGSLFKNNEPLNKEQSGLELALKGTIRRLGRPGGQPLPNDVRQKMESAFGADFSAVRVHVGPEASSIGALAVTYGSNIFFAPGWYSPHTAWGQRLLGHELTHVLQQRAGRVENPFASGITVVQDDALEAEADHMGRRAAAHGVDIRAKIASSAPGRHRHAVPRSRIGRRERGSSPSRCVVQCVFTGQLAAKPFEYFHREAEMQMKWTEFKQLQESPVSYSTLEAVKKDLESMRKKAPGPRAPSVVQASAPVSPALPVTWKCTYVGAFYLYRAVNLSPGKIKKKKQWTPLTNPALALPKAIPDLVKDPRDFQVRHVRANFNYIHSAAPDETCCNYAGMRDCVYRINVPGMYKYEPPRAASTILQQPTIWADTDDRTLRKAKRVAFGPSFKTGEIDLMFDISLVMIDRYKQKGMTNWVTIDWDTIKEEV
jgi:hypothetical protein